MKRRPLLVAVVALALASVFSGGIFAITNGVPDGTNHPYVAFLLFYAPDADGNIVPRWTCSGSLISETVVLTAGHCTDTGPGAGPATKAEVWFDSDVAAVYPGGAIQSAGVHTHPGFSWYGQGLLGWDTIDAGVVILNRPVTGRPFAALPPAALVDSLPMRTNVDVVGYGVQYKLQTSGPPYFRWVSNLMRFSALTEIVASENVNSDRWLKLTANPAQGKGGVCYGDSGGPALLAGTSTILATTSFGASANCTGVSYSNRVDRQVVLDWVQAFLN